MITEDSKIWLTLAASGLALAGTIYAAAMSRKGQRELSEKAAKLQSELVLLQAKLQQNRDDRSEEQQREKVVRKFRDPLMQAVFDLQSRLFNILKNNFLEAYLTNGSTQERSYAVENTVFLFAQLLGWLEAIRQETQFLDFGKSESARHFDELQTEVHKKLRTDHFCKGFRLFAGEQRAVGELMIERSGSEIRCLGFAAFSTRRELAIDTWLDPMREDIKEMAINPEPSKARLVAVQHALIDLLNHLDEGFVRYSKLGRTKV